MVPRIAMLSEAEEVIRECFPDIRIIKAHGRMGRNTAEENVSKFAEGGIDILLATTVIENGVDIPSVNTIIIQDSQNFGMAHTVISTSIPYISLVGISFLKDSLTG